MAPRLADYQLEQDQGSFVTNLKTTSGALRGFRSMNPIAALMPSGITYRRAVKLYYPGSDAFEWFRNTDVNSSVLQSPLANDAYNRVYYTDSTHSRMQITTLADIAAGTPSSDAGVARPTVAPGVTATGGVGVVEVRAYTYVWVSTFGENGPPSPPRLVTGKIDSTWAITTTAPTDPDIQFVDIYRTQTGKETSGAYYRIARLAPGHAAYTDTMSSAIVPLQPPLSSFDNDPPPVGLQGIILHSSGAVAGFVGRDVYFSAPYLPHAWPTQIKYTMPFEIVGLAAVSNSIIVMTKGHPVALTGTKPDGVSANNLSAAEPCLANRSIVVSNNIVMYASPNGIASVGASGLDRPTNLLITQEDWPDFDPENLVAAIYGSYYVGFYDASNGLAVSLPPYEPSTLVRLNRYDRVSGVETDARTSGLHIVQADTVSQFDDVDDIRFATTWRSKMFILASPTNMGAFQIVFDKSKQADILATVTPIMTGYNATRFAQGPLNCIGASAINAGILIDPAIAAPAGVSMPPIAPLGGQPLYDVDALLALLGIRFTLIADDAVKYSRLITTQGVHKLPSGYKATKLYLELSGAVEVQRIVVAETARECREA